MKFMTAAPDYQNHYWFFVKCGFVFIDLVSNLHQYIFSTCITSFWSCLPALVEQCSNCTLVLPIRKKKYCMHYNSRPHSRMNGPCGLQIWSSKVTPTHVTIGNFIIHCPFQPQPVVCVLSWYRNVFMRGCRRQFCIMICVATMVIQTNEADMCLPVYYVHIDSGSYLTKYSK